MSVQVRRILIDIEEDGKLDISFQITGSGEIYQADEFDDSGGVNAIVGAITKALGQFDMSGVSQLKPQKIAVKASEEMH